jgi:hypothetical protein
MDSVSVAPGTSAESKAEVEVESKAEVESVPVSSSLVEDLQHDWAKAVNERLWSDACTMSVRQWADKQAQKLDNRLLQGVYLQNAKGLSFNVTGIGQPAGFEKSAGGPYKPTDFQPVATLDLWASTDWGAKHASRALYAGFNGVCDACSLIGAAVLAAQEGIPEGLKVEQLGRGTRPLQRHTYVAIGREDSGQDYAGAKCYILDHWWALQRGGVPSIFRPGSATFKLWEADMNSPYSTSGQAYAYKSTDPQTVSSFMTAKKPSRKIQWGTGKYDELVSKSAKQ